MQSSQPGSARRRTLAATTLAAATAALGVAAVAAPAAAAPNTAQVSVTTGGLPPANGANNHGHEGERRQLSADGRFVVFAASGPVVAGQPSLRWQIVLRDRRLGTSTLISTSSAGVAGNHSSTMPSISADGRVVAFHSHASNLVAGDTNGQADIFVHDVRTGTTTRASVTAAGTEVPPGQIAGDNPVGPPAVSADGTWVGFTARVHGLTADDGDNSGTRAYLHNRTTGAIEVVSRGQLGEVIGVLPDTAVSPSADGRHVAIISGNATATPGDTNSDPDVMVRDRLAGTTTRIPAGEDGATAFALSADGRRVVFRSTTGNLPPERQNGISHLFLHDLDSGTTDLITAAADGGPANGHSNRPTIGADGRHIAFHSAASNLVAGDTNGATDVFRHDRATGRTERVSLTNRGAQSPTSAQDPSISADGDQITFESHATTLTATATRGYGQLFVRDLSGRFPVLRARLGTLPARVGTRAAVRITTRDIRAGQRLVATWTPVGRSGGVVRRTVAVRANTLTLRAPARAGRHRLTVSYDGHDVGGRTVAVAAPRVTSLPGRVAAGRPLTIRTAGLPRGRQVQVRFRPSAGGAQVQRSGRTDAAGRVRVAAPTRAGHYRVAVRSAEGPLGGGSLRVG